MAMLTVYSRIDSFCSNGIGLYSMAQVNNKIADVISGGHIN